MTLLPIVERELRVAARRWYTFWGRLAAAAFALIVFIGLQVIAEFSRGAFKPGHVQFEILKWMCFSFAATAGVFLTSDSLSEEKREGTLGLLFLTDLRGHDVVLGKLISRSLQAFYGLVAAIPVIGLTILSGGVAGAEFGHALLVVGNTLFLSLSAGLFISAVSRDVMKAMNGTLFLLLLLVVGVFFIDWGIGAFDWSTFKPICTLASPAYLFYQTGPYLFREYWLCLGIQHGIAWAFLILSCIYAPRAWQDKSTGGKSKTTSLAQRLRFGSPRSRLRMRRRLLERDPILWLGLRDRWMGRFTMTIFVIGLMVTGVCMAYYWSWGPLQAAGYVQYVFRFLLYLWLASQASRFFVDAIRTGAMELTLVTPIVPAQIIRGQWRALLRTYLAPALIIVAVVAGGATAEYFQYMRSMAHASGNTGTFNWINYELLRVGVSLVIFLGNLVAVAWFGMWMGLITRKASFAVFKTLCFVIVLPWIGLSFAEGMMYPLSAMAKLPLWTATLIAGGLSVAKNVLFIVLARQRLYGGFKDAVLREGRMAPIVLPPPLPPPPMTTPPPMPPPPIIRAGAA